MSIEFTPAQTIVTDEDKDALLGTLESIAQSLEQIAALVPIVTQILQIAIETHAQAQTKG